MTRVYTGNLMRLLSESALIFINKYTKNKYIHSYTKEFWKIR